MGQAIQMRTALAILFVFAFLFPLSICAQPYAPPSQSPDQFYRQQEIRHMEHIKRQKQSQESQKGGATSDYRNEEKDKEVQEEESPSLIDYKILEFREHLKKGRELLKRKLYKEALSELNRAVGLNPYSTEGVKLRGITYRKLRLYQRALPDLTKAIIDDPGDYESFYNRGVTYYYLSRNNEAVNDLTAALQINPQSFNSYFFRGMAYMGMKKTREALADFKSTLEIKPDHKYAREKVQAIMGSAGPADQQETDSVVIKLPDVDSSIPRGKKINKDAIAVIIGNRDYKKAKRVNYAINDVRAVKNYLISTFGFRSGNIFHLENATQSDFYLYFGNKDSHKGKLFNAVKPRESDVFIYYSGHGAPGLKDKSAYFVPVEADPQYLELGGYPVDLLYRNIERLPARSVTIVMDACFSGTDLFENISPMVVTVSTPVLRMENAVVLSSSGSEQVSTWLNERRHGLYTYFFLKGIKDRSADVDKDGKISFDEIHGYLADPTEGVPYYARRIHGVEQNPTIEGSYSGRSLVSY
jgi:tetratricopeptide (TPR) repeat protein